MNKYSLYQEAYGNDAYWREGYVDTRNNTFITLNEYAQRTKTEDMSSYKLVYPEADIEQKRNDRSQLPGFQEIIRGSTSDAQAALLGWSCAYGIFKEKLALEDTTFYELSTRYNLVNSTYLAELFVRPDQQGKGLGHTLLSDYIVSCKDAGKQGILTRTTSLKPNPKNMFLKAGFESVREYGPDDPRKRELFYLFLT